MPTWDSDARFLREFGKLSQSDQIRLRSAVADFVSDLKVGGRARAGLRVKGVQGHDGVFEMTWAPDGRATFSFGVGPKPGHIHVTWRRCGGHEIFADP